MSKNNSYTYKGKEKFIKDIEEHKPMYLSIVFYLFVFFNFSFHIASMSPFFLPNFLSTYINLNIGNNNSFSSDLKNASLYLFSAQATLIGLIFPIIIAYVSLANVGRASSDKLMNIYKEHTGFNTLSNSAFLLLGFYAFIFILDSLFNLNIFKFFQFSFLIWFTFNLFLIYIFLSKTIDFIYGAKKIEEVTKFSYNNKDKINDSFLIIIDEIKYFLESKSISRVEELEINLADFIKINFIQHKLNHSDITTLLTEIKRLIDTTLDYSDITSIRKMLYIYFYIGNRLINYDKNINIESILNFNHTIIYDLDKKVNLNEKFKENVYSSFLDAWSSWDYVLKDNDNKATYEYYNLMIISFFLNKNININNILDIFLRTKQNHSLNLGFSNSLTALNEFKKISDTALNNYYIDIKFILIKNIIDSEIEIKNKITYINSILKNISPLLGTSQIRSNTKIQSASDLLFSLLRIISNESYSEFLKEMYDRSKPSDRVVNRMYWMDTSSYLSKFAEIYAYIYDQFILSKGFPNTHLDNYLNSLTISERFTFLQKINIATDVLNKTSFEYDFFNVGKKNYIKKRFINFFNLTTTNIKNNIISYHTKKKLDDTTKTNIFFIYFSDIYNSIVSSSFSPYINWKIKLNNPKIVPFEGEIPFTITEPALESNIIHQNSAINLFNNLFINEIIKNLQHNKISSSQPINEIVKTITSQQNKKFLVFIFNKSFFKDILDPQNNHLNINPIGNDIFLINGILFKFIRNYQTQFYGVIIEKDTIYSIDILTGDQMYKSSKIEPIVSPSSDFNLYYSISYNFEYKVKVNKNQPIILLI